MGNKANKKANVLSRYYAPRHVFEFLSSTLESAGVTSSFYGELDAMGEVHLDGNKIRIIRRARALTGPSSGGCRTRTAPVKPDAEKSRQ